MSSCWRRCLEFSRWAAGNLKWVTIGSLLFSGMMDQHSGGADGLTGSDNANKTTWPCDSKFKLWLVCKDSPQSWSQIVQIQFTGSCGRHRYISQSERWWGWWRGGELHGMGDRKCPSVYFSHFRNQLVANLCEFLNLLILWWHKKVCRVTKWQRTEAVAAGMKAAQSCRGVFSPFVAEPVPETRSSSVPSSHWQSAPCSLSWL